MYRWLHCIFIITLALTGCSRGKETQPANSVVFSFPESDLSLYRNLINEFYIESPGITVILEPTPAKKLGDQNGDVQVVTWDIEGEETTWSADDYLDLKTLADKDGIFNPQDFYPGSFLPFTKGNKLAAIPYGLDIDVLYYNKEIFNNQKVALPNQNWSLDNFLDAAARLTDRENFIYGYSAHSAYLDSLYFLYQSGGNLQDENGNWKLDSAINIQAVSWYGLLFTTLNVAPTIEQAQRSFGYVKDIFATGISNGKIGMWYDEFSAMDTTSPNYTPFAFEVGVASLPHGEKTYTSGVFEAFAISKHAKDVEASWKLVKFLSQQPNSRLVPARRTVAESSVYARLVGAEAVAAAKILAEHTISIPYDKADEFIKVKKVFLEAVASVIRLKMTTEQALQQAQLEISKP